MPSPVGPLLLAGEDEVLTRVEFGAGRRPVTIDPSWVLDEAAVPDAAAQLAEYFAGTRRAFDLALRPAGTPFQLDVWSALRTIPYGATWSYGQLARQLARPGAVRAVGLANGRNPLPIIVPCHRVIGSDGSLTGFGGGLDAKRWLLEHEAGASRRR
jgi:methylated-DNA-[protein]-cysteine S-methyltransferase